MAVYAIDWITIIVNIYFLIYAVRRIKKETRYIFYCIFYVIFALPVLLDYVVGYPNYLGGYSTSKYYGFIYSQYDAATRILYGVFLLVVGGFVLYYRPKYRFVIGKVHAIGSVEKEFILSNLEKRACMVLAAVAPILVVVRGLNPRMLIEFGWRELPVAASYLAGQSYSSVEKMTYIGIVSSLSVLMWNKSGKKGISHILQTILFCLLLYMNLCIESKRSILFFSFVIIFLIQLYSHKPGESMTGIIVGAVLLMVAVVGSTVFVKLNYRGYEGFDSVYRSLRIDIFRDDTVKMAIYSFLGKNIKPMLDYPLQSYLTSITSIFPLDYITGYFKIPIPRLGFNNYLTCALIGVDLNADIKFMTTSMFDELIANFWYLGIIIGGIFIVKISRIIDRFSGFEKILWSGGIILMMFYSLNYIMYYLEIVFVYSFIIKRLRIR